MPKDMARQAVRGRVGACCTSRKLLVKAALPPVASLVASIVPRPGSGTATAHGPLREEISGPGEAGSFLRLHRALSAVILLPFTHSHERCDLMGAMRPHHSGDHMFVEEQGV